MVEWILDRVAELDEVRTVHVVTNSVYAPAFAHWAEGKGVVVHDDGTSSNEDRLGALGDILFAVDHGGLEDDDLLVIAADNLFRFSLGDYVAFWRSKGGGSALAVHTLADPALASLYGVVELDRDDRVVGLEEKPAEPKSELVSTATYLFSREHLPLLRRYLDEGNPPDPPGAFLVWLHRRAPVWGYRFSEEWLDIGDPGQLLEADNRYRTRAGLAPRERYSPTEG
jgi:glucose-1-phosphate thymidylyltransferase